LFSNLVEEFSFLKSFDDDYYPNLKNSNLHFTEGQANFLADAYYNNIPTIIYPNLNDLECLISSNYAANFNAAFMVKSNYYDFNIIKPKFKNYNYNFLHDVIF
jgi:hypothetical protein